MKLQSNIPLFKKASKQDKKAKTAKLTLPLYVKTNDNCNSSCMNCISILTQVIIEILALSLAENGVIFHYNHLRRGDYSGSTKFEKLS